MSGLAMASVSGAFLNRETDRMEKAMSRTTPANAANKTQLAERVRLPLRELGMICLSSRVYASYYVANSGK
jgi:hypothetical protein